VILVDTSVWVEHLRKGAPRLTAALDRGDVLMHPFVLGELACGNVRNRREILRLFGDLPAAPIASEGEALEFIERRSLGGSGIGYVDVHLLASVALSDGARLWTGDKRLAVVAAELELAYL
jgi:predicted nucleic acid-binding protein